MKGGTGFPGREMKHRLPQLQNQENFVCPPDFVIRLSPDSGLVRTQLQLGMLRQDGPEQKLFLSLDLRMQGQNLTCLHAL